MKVGRSLALLAGALSVSGCLGGVAGSGGRVAELFEGAAAPRSVRVEEVTVAGPAGFCIDPSATKHTSDVSFVLLGSCGSLANSTALGQPRRPGVLTASIGPRSEASIARNAEALVALLSGPQGRDMLATEGAADAVSVSQVDYVDGAILVHAADPTLTAARGLQPDYWRGFLDLGDRVATLTVFSLSSRPLSDQAGRALLQSFVDVLRQANAKSTQPAPEANS